MLTQRKQGFITMATTNTTTNTKGVTLAKSAALPVIAKATPTATKTAPTAAQAFSFANGAPVTFNSLRAWCNANAGGIAPVNLARVAINVLPNVNAQWAAQGLKGPVPFGYGGNPLGQRATLLNIALNSATLAAYFATCAKSPTTKCETTGNPNVLTALLNGGFTPSAKTWGTPFVTLSIIA